MGSHEDGLTNRDYARLCKLVYAEAGIHLGTGKKIMLEVRIKRRLRDLDLDSYAQYCDYLFGHKGLKEEIVPLIDVVTTNKTDFFREPGHFKFLAEKAIPEMVARRGNQLLVWSAGCSTGEEPYTLAMVMSEYAQAHPGFGFKVLATDISTTVLKKAEMGIYTDEVVSPVPDALKRKYFMRSRDRDSNRVRVVPELRRLVEFRRLNFMEENYGLAEKANAIFCRNVIIYFDRPTQERILSKLSHHLVPRGFMFVGHAETLHDMNLPLEPVAPALYRRIDA
jgi:chemotaxis protein methyltransferase CheR